VDEEQQRYVEDFGLFFERFGLSRMVGRVLGVLLIRPPERSAEELADMLRASRGSISQATRSLVQMGLVQRLTKPGERRDYFRVRQGTWMELTRQQMSATTTLREIAERGLELLDPGDPEARRSLEEMRNFYAFWERELPVALERWENESQRRDPKVLDRSS
jgi:DNA-binding transcriptional regulator GbsR (MarR family)